MKKDYICPQALFVLGDDLCIPPMTPTSGDGWDYDPLAKSGDLVWDDDSDGEDDNDNWGYSGF